jgi:1,2-diacylglycerol 3-alpha-glucosyltransferase
VRILEATDFYYPWIAGPAPFIQNLSTGLAELGHDVSIVCPSPTGRPYTEPGNPEHHRVRTWSVPVGYQLRAGFPLVDLAGYSRAWRPDIVHIHHPFPISLSALSFAKLGHIPVVATNHTIPECSLYGMRNSRWYGPAHSTFAFYLRHVLHRADAVTTPTATAANMLRRLGFDRTVVPISNGVDMDRFRPPADEQPHEAEPIVLYTGRLDAEKDMDTLIGAIPHVLEHVTARFRIGGEGADRARLERLVKDLGVAHAVSFTGYASEQELPAVYQSSSVYAISSPVELQSISTLEAMASGLPVVAVNAGALPELVRPGVNGHLAAAGDVNAFAAGLVELIADRAQRRTMGAASRTIAQEHGLKRMVQAYNAIFQELTSEHVSRAVAGTA